MTVSSFALSVLIDHDGVMRRSADEFSETTRSGTSAIVPVRETTAPKKTTHSRVKPQSSQSVRKMFLISPHVIKTKGWDSKLVDTRLV